MNLLNHCTLLIGRSRVAPLKFVSIPRLELTAATLPVKISKMLKNQLNIRVDDELFWTDSKVILQHFIINPRQLTVETISDLKSEMLLSPSDSLIIKTDFVMRPSCEFSKQDIAMIMSFDLHPYFRTIVCFLY